MPESKNRKGHDKKVAYRKQLQRERKNKYDKMFAQFQAMMKEKYSNIPEMLNKEDKDSLSGSPDQTLGKPEPPNGLPNGKPWNEQDATVGYAVVDMPERDPNEPIVINEPFHIVGTPEEEAEQKRIQDSAVTTSYSGPITKKKLDNFIEDIKNDN